MNDMLNKLIAVARETAAEKGKYNLFAFLLREESPDKWDVVVSAPWIANDREGALKYLAQKIQNAFVPNELLRISRIVIIEENNPALTALQNSVHLQHGATEVKDTTLFGLPIKQAFFIASGTKQAA